MPTAADHPAMDMRWIPGRSLPQYAREQMAATPDLSRATIHGVLGDTPDGRAFVPEWVLPSLRLGCLGLAAVFILPILITALAYVFGGVVAALAGDYMGAVGPALVLALLAAATMGTIRKLRRWSLGALGGFMLGPLARRFAGDIELRVADSTLQPGQELIWFLRFQPREVTNITAIRASIEAIDLSQFDPAYDDDGNPLPPDRVAARLEASIDGQREILAGEEIVVPGRGTLPDPATIATRDPGAPLRWWLEVSVERDRVPAWRRRVPLRVEK